MYPASIKLGLSIIVIAATGGAVIVIKNVGRHGTSAPQHSASLVFAMPPEIVHTADWYATHPDFLKADDARCGSDAASISQAACQNAATADQRLLAAQLQQATGTNAMKSASPKSR